MLLQSIVAAVIPAVIYTTLIYYVDRYEKEPLWLLITTFVWGAVPAVVLAIIFNGIFGLPFYAIFGEASDALVASFVAPLVEESIKGVMLLIIFFLWREQIDSLLDGIIYGAIVGMGFAMVENVFYFETVFAEEGLEAWQFNIFLRAIVFGLNHALFTSMTGLGVAYARMTPNLALRFVAPVIGWGVSVFMHTVHNLAASSGETLGAVVCIPLVCQRMGGAVAHGRDHHLVTHPRTALDSNPFTGRGRGRYPHHPAIPHRHLRFSPSRAIVGSSFSPTAPAPISPPYASTSSSAVWPIANNITTPYKMKKAPPMLTSSAAKWRNVAVLFYEWLSKK